MAIFLKIIAAFFRLWWLWLPVVLFAGLVEIWTRYLKFGAIKAVKWILLEIKVPKDIEKTPKSMEQIFSGLHGILTGIKFTDKYYKGKIQDWFSFEIVGIDGAVYFFVRTPEQFRNLVEAQIYSQYPDAEIHETVDYAGPLAQKTPSQTYDVSGGELILSRENFYPIKTYQVFEEKETERRVDPLAAFLEILSKLRPGENIFIQYLIKPTGEKWESGGVDFINKLLGRKKEKKSVLGEWLEGLGDFVQKLIKAPHTYPEWDPKKTAETKAAIGNLSPGEKIVAEAVENKMSQLAFNVGIRFAYVGRSDIFNKANIAAVIGAFKQFNTMNLNAFKTNGKAGTSADWPFFKKRREFLKKKRLISRHIDRKWPEKDFILTTEELATIYHYPIIGVEAPTLRRVEAKKGEPPVSLPVS